VAIIAANGLPRLKVIYLHGPRFALALCVLVMALELENTLNSCRLLKSFAIERSKGAMVNIVLCGEGSILCRCIVVKAIVSLPNAHSDGLVV